MKKTTYTHKVTAAVLMAVLLAPLLYVAFHLAALSTHKMHMRKSLRHSMLQTITLDSASVVWVEYGREIRVSDHYFDVEHIEYANGKAIITGLYDVQEATLHQQLQKAQSDTPGYAWQNGQVAKWLLTLWAPATANQLISFLPVSIQAAQPPVLTISYGHCHTPDRPPQAFRMC